MGEYAIAVFAVSAVVSVLGYFAYRKSAAVASALAVLILYAVLAPVIEYLAKFDVNDIYSEIEGASGEYGEEYIAVTRDALSDGIRRLVCEKYSLSVENVRVLLEGFDFDSMKAERIRIILSGKAITADRLGIAEYINKYEWGRCEVEIEIG